MWKDRRNKGHLDRSFFGLKENVVNLYLSTHKTRACMQNTASAHSDFFWTRGRREIVLRKNACGGVVRAQS